MNETPALKLVIAVSVIVLIIGFDATIHYPSLRTMVSLRILNHRFNKLMNKTTHGRWREAEHSTIFQRSWHLGKGRQRRDSEGSRGKGSAGRWTVSKFLDPPLLFFSHLKYLNRTSVPAIFIDLIQWSCALTSINNLDSSFSCSQPETAVRQLAGGHLCSTESDSLVCCTHCIRI